MSWGSAGAQPGQFDFPRGLSTDEIGNLFVADRNNHRMQMFTGAGVFLTSWGSSGAGEGQFNFPYAVRAGANGVVYVNDSSNHRLQKFAFTAPCPWDCDSAESTDGNVGIVDFLTLLSQWGGPGSCDFDGGGVGIVDFLDLLAHWGPCP